MNWANIRWFKEKEFLCQCGCEQRCDMEYQLVNAMDWLREIFGVPITVTSGHRCPTHNKAVGGADNSFHLTGEAADITVARKNLLPLIYRVAVVSGRFSEVGIKENSFIHLATGKKRAPDYYIYLPEGGTKVLNPDILEQILKENVEEHLREYKI